MSTAERPALIRETFPVGPLQCNCDLRKRWNSLICKGLL